MEFCISNCFDNFGEHNSWNVDELCFKRLISRHQTRQRLRRVLRFAYARTVLFTRNKPAYADLTLDIFSTRPQPKQLDIFSTLMLDIFSTHGNSYLQEPRQHQTIEDDDVDKEDETDEDATTEEARR